MPELPEVETVRRSLAQSLTGARIEFVQTRRAGLRFPFPRDFRERLRGVRILSFARRAKYLLVALDSGDTLVSHLGMSGSFRIEDVVQGDFLHPRSKDPKHDHVIFCLEGGKTLTYNDPRRFGFLALEKSLSLESAPVLKGLGIEPLSAEFGPARLASLFAGSRLSLKVGLLDQRRIAGLGNIYACESLWRAKLLPSRPAGSLTDAVGKPTQAAKALAPAIRDVLDEAIKAGGSTLRDHRQPDGDLGYFQHSFAVYDREGQSCPRVCGGIILRTVQSNRSSFWCPMCQT